MQAQAKKVGFLLELDIDLPQAGLVVVVDIGQFFQLAEFGLDLGGCAVELGRIFTDERNGDRLPERRLAGKAHLLGIGDRTGDPAHGVDHFAQGQAIAILPVENGHVDRAFVSGRPDAFLHF